MAVCLAIYHSMHRVAFLPEPERRRVHASRDAAPHGPGEQSQLERQELCMRSRSGVVWRETRRCTLYSKAGHAAISYAATQGLVLVIKEAQIAFRVERSCAVATETRRACGWFTLLYLDPDQWEQSDEGRQTRHVRRSERRGFLLGPANSTRVAI